MASYRPASHAHLPYMARNFENAPRHPPAVLADAAQMAIHTMSSYRGMDASLYLGFALSCHSNPARAQIANPPNSAQLGGNLYHAPKLHPGPCSSVGVRPRTDTHTDRQTHRRAGRQYILRRLRRRQNVISFAPTHTDYSHHHHFR